MPTYEYSCKNGHEFEEFQSMVAPPVEVCPICGAPAERKISGGSGLIFKGSGFYITDYAKKNSSGAASSSKSSGSSDASSSSTSTDKKS
ncbi:MAG: zinc ribbon domain-containing protein [Calditrichaeota bacterium]|nr:zinc ribbon domain-containing protein [Calditrichota bacterium]MCB9367747.1 zinc ribbon domain-containing protein [Calditrichota bacterium]